MLLNWGVTTLCRVWRTGWSKPVRSLWLIFFHTGLFCVTVPRLYPPFIKKKYEAGQQWCHRALLSSEITLVVQRGPGRWGGEEQWGGRRRLTQPLKTWRIPGFRPESPTSTPLPSPCLMVPWERGGWHLQRRVTDVTTKRPRSSSRAGRWQRGLRSGQWKGRPHPDSHSSSSSMASASTSAQSAFGLGRKKKSPGLMDQISKIFGGEKKKRSKVSVSLSFNNTVCWFYSRATQL